MNDVSLTSRLVPYPNLADALGPKWVEAQDCIDPVESSYPLARWLRMDGFEPDLTTINEILGRLAAVPGIADRKKRIRFDALGFMETLTELYFAAWILDHGYSFDWPNKGADFSIHLATNQRLLLEVTTPRRAVWSEEIFDRLVLVAQRTGCAAELALSTELLPETASTASVVNTVVREALGVVEQLGANMPGHHTDQVHQTYPEYGLQITWTHSAEPSVRKMTSPEPISPYSGFNYLVECARKKHRQLPEEQAGALLVGTVQLPRARWWSFLDALRNPHLGINHFDWTRLPKQVKYVVLYSQQLRQIEPFKALCITNPSSPFNDPPGAEKFLSELFPHALQRMASG